MQFSWFSHSEFGKTVFSLESTRSLPTFQCLFALACLVGPSALRWPPDAIGMHGCDVQYLNWSQSKGIQQILEPYPFFTVCRTREEVYSRRHTKLPSTHVLGNTDVLSKQALPPRCTRCDDTGEGRYRGCKIYAKVARTRCVFRTGVLQRAFPYF